MHDRPQEISPQAGLAEQPNYLALEQLHALAANITSYKEHYSKSNADAILHLNTATLRTQNMLNLAGLATVKAGFGRVAAKIVAYNQACAEFNKESKRIANAIELRLQALNPTRNLPVAADSLADFDSQIQVLEYARADLAKRNKKLHQELRAFKPNIREISSHLSTLDILIKRAVAIKSQLLFISPTIQAVDNIVNQTLEHAHTQASQPLLDMQHRIKTILLAANECMQMLQNYYKEDVSELTTGLRQTKRDVENTVNRLFELLQQITVIEPLNANLINAMTHLRTTVSKSEANLKQQLLGLLLEERSRIKLDQQNCLSPNNRLKTDNKIAALGRAINGVKSMTSVNQLCIITEDLLQDHDIISHRRHLDDLFKLFSFVATTQTQLAYKLRSFAEAHGLLVFTQQPTSDPRPNLS